MGIGEISGMEYGSVPFEKRIRENIKNYAMDNLYPVDSLREHLKALAALTGAELLLTDRQTLPDFCRM